jgi:hypothetical protein
LRFGTPSEALTSTEIQERRRTFLYRNLLQHARYIEELIDQQPDIDTASGDSCTYAGKR